MRGMHDRKQTKTLGGREEEGDTARRKRDREGEKEKYGKEEDKSSLCCGDFHAHFRMQLVRGHLPTVSDVYTVRCYSVAFHVLYPSRHLERTHVDTAGSHFIDVRSLRENAMIRNITQTGSERSYMIKLNRGLAQEHMAVPACLPDVCSGEGRLWETITQLHHMVNTGHHKLKNLKPHRLLRAVPVIVVFE